MKPKILPEKVEEIKFVDYRKLFYKELKRMKTTYKTPKEATNFLVIGEWEFPDFPKKKLPLVIIGSMRGAWEKYYKNSVKGKKTSGTYGTGKCRFGEMIQTGQEFLMEFSHGTLKTTHERLLEKTLFKKVKLVPTTVPKGTILGGEELSLDETPETTGNTNNTVTPRTMSPKVGKKEITAQIKKQSKEMKKNLDNLKGQFKKVKHKVAKSIKKGKVGRKEFVIMQGLQEQYTNFKTSFESAHEKLKGKFAKAKETLDQQNKAFAKLALVVKARKRSLAQQLADSFYSKTEDRIATEEEVNNMQASVKEAIDYRQITSRSGEEKKMNLKAIYMTARHKGPSFKPSHTDITYKKLQ